MRLFNWLAVTLLAPYALAHGSSSDKPHHGDILAYELNSQLPSEVTRIDTKQALLYLADKYNVASNLAIGHGEEAKEAIEFIGAHRGLNRANSNKPKMVITIDGVDWSELRNDTSFVVSHGNPLKLAHKLVKNFVHSPEYKKIKLTEEMKLMTKHNNTELYGHFKAFNDKLVTIWKSFTSSQSHSNPANNQGDQIVLKEDMGVLRLINDKFFINEISQLIHLQASAESLESTDVVMLHIHSLLSVGKKTGFDSLTYRISNKVLSNYLNGLSTKFDITLLTTNDQYQHTEAMKKSHKRSLQLREIFAKTDLDGKSGGCFTSEESCKDATNSCSGHGECIKSKVSECWSCGCTPTFNKTSQRTTYWAGGDCSKKDISSQANLLLWTGVALLVMIVGGIQLMYSVGNEPLSGVLDAATMLKKTN